MATFSPKARNAADDSRRVNMQTRAQLAKKYGGRVGDYYPSRIGDSISKYDIPLSDVPAKLLNHAKMAKAGSVPPDSPIFDKPVKKAAKPKAGSVPLDSPIFDKPVKKAAKPKGAKMESDRELVLKLLQLAVKFL